MAHPGRRVVALVAVLVCGAAIAAEPPRRAAPPADWPRETLDAFFDDAREALEGERPAAVQVDSPAAASSAVADGGQFAWSRLISADALDTEVKRIAGSLTAPLASAEAFKAGGNEQCRAAFSLLATLLAVIENYDGEVRWQRDAAVMRVALTRAAANCKSASDQSFAEAVERRHALDDLIRGGRADGDAAAPVERWSDVADRGPLMQRMQVGMVERINPQLADARTFARAAADVQHEAELLAALAEIIRREQYEFWDDDTFNEYAEELGTAAGDLSRAAADKDYETARTAAGRVGQACAACHDGYRG